MGAGYYRRAVQWGEAGLKAYYPPLLQLQLCSAEHIYCCENILKSQATMSDAEVKNDVAAEAPSAEELKAKKRTAEVYFLEYLTVK